MRGTDLYLAMQELDDAIIEKCTRIQIRRSIPLRKLIAASLAAVLLAGGIGVAVDAMGYKQATDFFARNGLSTQGLSRQDVRAVYRDIITKSFTYEKTDDVIAEGIEKNVPGYEITADMDDPEDLRQLWESWTRGELEKVVVDGVINEFDGDTYQKGVWYDAEGISIYNPDKARSETRETVVYKYQDDTLCWESTVPFIARLMKPIGECTVVIGEKEIFSELIPESASLPKADSSEQIAFLDKNGQLLWHKQFEEEADIAFLDTDWAFDNGDESFTLFTRSTRTENGEVVRTVLIWRFGLNGEQLAYKEFDIGQYGLSNVTQLMGHYVLLQNIDKMAPKLTIIDADGEAMTGAEYQITDQLQSIKDVVQGGNYFYISARTMLAGEGEDEIGRPNVALSQEKKTLWEQRDTLSEKELLERIRSHYTAVLLRCDIETGEIESFYSVPGVIADKLEVSDEGKLVWHLQSLTQAEMQEIPNRNAYLIRGTSVIYRYTFDGKANLIKTENTGELATYRW